MRIFTAVLLLLLTTTGFSQDSHHPKAPAGLRHALEHSTRIEIISINPTSFREEAEPEKYPSFHGLEVVGKGRLEGEKARALATAVLRGIDEGGGAYARCFIPHHGLICDGYELVICYQCGRLDAYSPDGKCLSFPIDKGGKSEFQAAFREQHIRSMEEEASKEPKPVRPSSPPAIVHP